MKKSSIDINEVSLPDYNHLIYNTSYHKTIYNHFQLFDDYSFPFVGILELKQYCVYITIYSGDIFPPKLDNNDIKPYLYIGSAYTCNVLDGYNGTVCSNQYKKLWTKERKHNKELFKTYIIKLFDDKAECNEYEGNLQLLNNAKYNPLYLNKVHSNKKFNYVVTEDMRKQMSERQKNRTISSETIERMRLANIGENNPMYGKCGELHHNYGKPMSEQQKQKLSEYAKLTQGGANNKKATEYHLIDPEGNKHIVIGGFEKFCNDNNISEGILRYNMGKGVIKSLQNNPKMTDKSFNTIGWSVTKVGRVHSK